MNKSLNKSQVKSEAPKVLNFRTAIFLLLGAIAASGVGGYLIGKSSGRKRDQVNITDAKGVIGSKDSAGKYPKSWISADENTEGLVNLAECRLLVLSLDTRVISEDEIVKMADKINKGQKNITADGIFANFCIEDADDKKAILEFIAKGYKLHKVKKNYDETWAMFFKKDLDKDNEEYLELKEKSVCKLLTPKEEADFEKEKRDAEKMQSIAQMVKEGKYNELAAEFDPKKIKDKAFLLGIENEDMTKELIKAAEIAQELLKSSADKETRIKKACSLFMSLAKMDVLGDLKKISSDLKDKLEQLPGDGLDDFVKEYFKSLGIDEEEECLMKALGVSPEGLK